MLRRLSQVWRSCGGSVFSCGVLRAYVVANFLFVGIFLSVLCMRCGRGVGALLRSAVVGNIASLDFLDLS